MGLLSFPVKSASWQTRLFYLAFAVRLTHLPNPDPKIAFLGVIIIWITTPLAIKWSGEGIGFLFGVTGRMVAGVIFAILVLALLRVALPRNERTRRAYLAAGLGIFATMTCVHWSAQHIPSGWISVIFGLTPMATGAMAFYPLGEKMYSLHRVGGWCASEGATPEESLCVAT